MLTAVFILHGYTAKAKTWGVGAMAQPLVYTVGGGWHSNLCDREPTVKSHHRWCSLSSSCCVSICLQMWTIWKGTNDLNEYIQLSRFYFSCCYCSYSCCYFVLIVLILLIIVLVIVLVQLPCWCFTWENCVSVWDACDYCFSRWLLCSLLVFVMQSQPVGNQVISRPKHGKSMLGRSVFL